MHIGDTDVAQHRSGPGSPQALTAIEQADAKVKSAEVARARGSSALHVLGNPHAERFYLSCGFKTTGKESTRFGVGFRMHKPCHGLGDR